MTFGLLALLIVAQQPAGEPHLIPRPRADYIRRTGDGAALGAVGATDANLIEAAKLAGSKASAGDVRAYATAVLHDHQHSLTAGAALAKRLRITRLLPADSSVERGHTAEMAQLNVLTGSAFDYAYVRFTVDDHKAALAANARALAEATRPEVRKYLRAQPAVLRTHRHTGEAWLAAHP